MEEIKEIWKPIVGYEGYYEISNIGRVRSLRRTLANRYGKNFTIQERIMRLDNDKDGYKKVLLAKNGINKQMFVHRLVAQAFIPNPNNYPQINHKDECQFNNRVENLEWCTNKYNCNYGTRNIRHTLKRSNPVLQYDLQGNFIKRFPSAREAERQMSNGRIHITECCNGFCQTAGGYKWYYEKKLISRTKKVAPTSRRFAMA